MRHREFKKLAQGHTAKKWWRWHLNPGKLWPTVHYSALLKEMRKKKVLFRIETLISIWSSSFSFLAWVLPWSMQFFTQVRQFQVLRALVVLSQLLLLGSKGLGWGLDAKYKSSNGRTWGCLTWRSKDSKRKFELSLNK